MLEALAVIYKNDALAKERQLSPEQRLLFHQAESGPVMEELHAWLVRQFDQRRVEPNSSLGSAISYMLRHWEKLTLFLHVAGAPLDNNVCERALKRAILHRKNALFYKTRHGAHVGDLFMSMIHTCELCSANPFDYLTELERHADELPATPEHWMPWNYRQAFGGGHSPHYPLIIGRLHHCRRWRSKIFHGCRKHTVGYQIARDSEERLTQAEADLTALSNSTPGSAMLAAVSSNAATSV